MTLIKLEDAVKAVLAAAYEGSQGEAVVEIDDALEALRSLPTDDGVTDEMVKRAARAIIRPEEIIPDCDNAWTVAEWQARFLCRAQPCLCAGGRSGDDADRQLPSKRSDARKLSARTIPDHTPRTTCKHWRREMRRTLKLFVIAVAFPLAACDPQPIDTYQGYWDHPQDAEVKVYAMDLCLSAAQGPRSTQYNDWDEAIKACDEFSDGAARYCPPKDMAKCQPQYRRTREEVRSALKATQ